MRLRVLALVLLAWTVPRMTARGEAASAPVRVHVRVEGEADGRLLERLRGQTSDLPVELLAYPVDRPLGSFGDAVNGAFAHCRASSADVVVWLVAGAAKDREAAWIVALATCRDGRVLARRLEAGHPALGGDATAQSGPLEAAALVLRGALGVLAQGGTLGVVAAPALSGTGSGTAAARRSSARAVAEVAATAQTASAENAAPAASTPDAISALSAPNTQSPAASAENAAPDASTPDASTAPSTQPPAASARGSTHPAASAGASFESLAMLGWEHTWDGSGAAGQPGLRGTMAGGWGSTRLGLSASLGIGARHKDRYTTLTLARYTFAAAWRQLLWRRGDWALSAGLELGCALYHRSTHARDNLSRARAAALSPAALVSPLATAARRFGRLWLSLSAALDVLPWVPRFVYRTAEEGTRTALRLWPVAPRIALSVSIGRP
jgi:hypothetical protein